MKSLLVAAALGLGSLGLVGLTPAKADASWLSEALHRRYDPGYYAYYAPPVYDYGDYYGPSTSYYVDPGYVYPPPTVYYSTPYYTPTWSYYWWSGPRYYGHHHHEGWHGGHGWHHHHR
jgi:hypothetical protein